MTLNDMSRFHWARMSQAHYMQGALHMFEHGTPKEESMWYCLLEWAYYKDVADDMACSFEWKEWEQGLELMRKGCL